MIVSYDDLPRIRRDNIDETVVFRGGCFDIFHEGHVEALELARSLGSRLVVGVVSDQRIRERKGPDRPVRPEESRVRVVDALKSVDYAFIVPYRVYGTHIYSTKAVVEELQPDVIVQGEAEVALWLPTELIELRTRNISLIPDMRSKINSTTAIINAVVAMNSAGIQQ